MKYQCLYFLVLPLNGQKNKQLIWIEIGFEYVGLSVDSD